MSFYNLINSVTNQNYLFVPSDTPFKKKLSEVEINKLRTHYKIPLKTLTNVTRVFNYDIKKYSIMDLKKLLFVLLKIPVEKQHLWVKTKSISVDIKNSIVRRNKYDDTEFDETLFGKFPQTLGYLYRGEEGINYYSPNFLDTHYERIMKDPSDLLVNLHSDILGEYDAISNTCLLYTSPSPRD